MATLGNKKAFSGMVGNVVFRYRDGKQIVQSRPTKVKQTVATKKSASEFGSCSRWTKQLRNGLAPFLLKQTDATMHQRFTAAVYNAIKQNTTFPQGARSPLNVNMEELKGFEFNTHSPFASCFKPSIIAELTSSNEVAISIPYIENQTDIIFPNGCNTAKLAVFILATDFKDTTTPFTFYSLLNINKNISTPAQNLLTTTTIPAGYFVLAATKLLYYTPNVLTESNYLNNKNLSPAMVVLAKAVGV